VLLWGGQSNHVAPLRHQVFTIKPYIQRIAVLGV
jgi:hypothetical protein